MKSFNLLGINQEGKTVCEIKIKANNQQEALKIANRLKEEGKINFRFQKLSFIIKP